MHWEKRWFQYAILLLLALTWGSSFILMKIGLRSFDYMQAASIRILLASLFLLPLSLSHLKHLRKKDLKYLLIAGFIGSFFPAFLFTKAQTQIPSALAGMLNSLTPFFTLIIGWLLFRTKTGIRQILGLIIGLAGATGLVTAGEGLRLSDVNVYALFIVLATLFYGINVNVIKTYLTHLRGTQITSLSFMFLWPFALVYLLTSDLQAVVQKVNWPWHFAALATLGIIGTATAMLLMNSLIRYTSAIVASSVTYIIPVFAIFWGVIDGERITILHILCMVFVLGGVWMTNRKERRPKTQDPNQTEDRRNKNKGTAATNFSLKS